MIIVRAVAAACFAWTVSASIHDAMISRLSGREEFALMKRQNTSVGSPKYNCHDNCGQAILEIQNCGDSSVCSDSTFTTDYANCLQCAGPDNEDIWQYYGSELNATADSCGLSTTPASGTQDSVDAAIAASNSTEACEAAVASSTASATGASPTATSTSSSASPTSTSSSNAGHVIGVGFANYAVVVFGALFMLAL